MRLAQAEVDLDPGGVAGNRVVALAGVDGIGPGAADGDVAAGASRDRVLAARERIDTEHHVGRQLAAVGVVVAATVAEDRGGPAELVAIHDTAPVAEGDVAAIAAEDGV